MKLRAVTCAPPGPVEKRNVPRCATSCVRRFVTDPPMVSRSKSATVALLERNLAVIDAAIRESRDALARDPANAELRALFAAAARQKVELLRWATRAAT